MFCVIYNLDNLQSLNLYIISSYQQRSAISVSGTVLVHGWIGMVLARSDILCQYAGMYYDPFRRGEEDEEEEEERRKKMR